MMRKVRYKYYNKPITTRNNSNVQSHNQESKLNSTINAYSDAHTLTYDKILSPFNTAKKKIVVFQKKPSLGQPQTFFNQTVLPFIVLREKRIN